MPYSKQKAGQFVEIETATPNYVERTEQRPMRVCGYNTNPHEKKDGGFYNGVFIEIETANWKTFDKLISFNQNRKAQQEVNKLMLKSVIIDADKELKVVKTPFEYLDYQEGICKDFKYVIREEDTTPEEEDFLKKVFKDQYAFRTQYVKNNAILFRNKYADKDGEEPVIEEMEYHQYESNAPETPDAMEYMEVFDEINELIQDNQENGDESFDEALELINLIPMYIDNSNVDWRAEEEVIESKYAAVRGRVKEILSMYRLGSAKRNIAAKIFGPAAVVRASLEMREERESKDQERDFERDQEKGPYDGVVSDTEGHQWTHRVVNEEIHSEESGIQFVSNGQQVKLPWSPQIDEIPEVFMSLYTHDREKDQYTLKRGMKLMAGGFVVRISLATIEHNYKSCFVTNDQQEQEKANRQILLDRGFSTVKVKAMSDEAVATFVAKDIQPK